VISATIRVLGEADQKPVTLLLQRWRDGDATALPELMPLVYDELRRLAARYMRRERPGHTFRPTDLVSEAYLRLAGASQPALADRIQFYGIAARVMRQILVDHSRRRGREKRGGGERAVTFHDELVAGGRPDELVALDDALQALAELDERKARVIELHYFTGLTHAEVARVVGVHENTVARDLRLGEAWIHKYLREN
jgi:RNA polymerase sigma factor (TIGR02999 family)